MNDQSFILCESFGTKEFYPCTLEAAAALFEEVAANVPASVKEAYRQAKELNNTRIADKTIKRVIAEIMTQEIGAKLETLSRFKWTLKGQLPEGWTALPKNPTPAIIAAVKQRHPRNTFNRESYRNMVDDISAEITASYVVEGLPDGWVIVPKKMSGQCLTAWTHSRNSFDGDTYLGICEAAPQIPLESLYKLTFKPVKAPDTNLTLEMFDETFAWLKANKVPFKYERTESSHRSSTPSLEFSLSWFPGSTSVYATYLNSSFFKGVYSSRVHVMDEQATEMYDEYRWMVEKDYLKATKPAVAVQTILNLVNQLSHRDIKYSVVSVRTN